MTIQIVWDDDDQTTIRYDIPADWTWEQLYSARQVVYDWMDAAPHDVVYSIVYFVDGRVTVPKGMMSHFDELTSYSHPKSGLMVVVGAGRMMRIMFSGLKRLFVTTTGRPLDFAYAADVQEARRILADVRLL